MTTRSTEEVELLAQSLEIDADDAEAAAALRDLARERDEWERLATICAEMRDSARKERDSLRAEHERLRDALRSRVKQLELGYDELRTVNNRLLPLRAEHERLREACVGLVCRSTETVRMCRLCMNWCYPDQHFTHTPECPLAPGAGTGEGGGRG